MPSLVILRLVSGAALVQVPDSRSLFRGVRTATAIDPACRSANLFEHTVSHFFCRHAKDFATLCPNHLATELKRAFGDDRVFLDVRNIDAGGNFTDEIEEQVRQATVLLVLIGKDWLLAHDKYGRRRLDKQDDWVRKEIRIGLQRQPCKVIPVLIDDAELPDDADALPNDIAELLHRQLMQIRQANSIRDIEALRDEIEKAGFRRIRDSREDFSDQSFTDKLVLDVVVRLRQLQQRQGAEFVGRRDLLRELDRLFNRKTFRFEPLRRCAEQRWDDRLDSAYQTEKC